MPKPCRYCGSHDIHLVVNLLVGKWLKCNDCWKATFLEEPRGVDWHGGVGLLLDEVVGEIEVE